MKKCEWPPCGKSFYSHKLWARFCSELCRRHAFRKARREAVATELRGELTPCANEHCGNPFVRSRLGQIYCSDRCRKTTGNRARLERKKLVCADQPKAKRKRRSLLCHWCRGPHVSTACPNRAGAAVRLFGTQAPDGSYVPPPGVRVRVLEVPYSLRGDELTAILKSHPRMEKKRRHRIRALPKRRSGEADTAVG